ncbi:MAG: hypothetical protein AABO41_19425 [Acidobacteriota bacterium]
MKGAYSHDKREALVRALESHIRRLDQRLKRLRSASEYYSRFRGAIILAAVVSVISLRLVGDQFVWTLNAILVIVLSIAVFYHRRIKRSIARHEIWLKIKSTHVARLNLDWENIPSPPSIAPQPEHPYEIDLDITGERSLHQLMDTAITREGSERLRAWLLSSAPDVHLIQKRQSLVRELSSCPLFRDKFALFSALASKGSNKQWDASALLEWLQRSTPFRSLKPILFVLIVLSATNLILFTRSMLGLMPSLWQTSFLIYFSVLFLASLLRAREVGSFKEALSMELSLNQLRAVFQHLESYPHRDRPELAGLCAPFLNTNSRPSVQLKRVERLASALSLRANPIVWFCVHALVPWDFYYAIRLNQAKARIKSLLPVWLDILFELEALNSLANFAYLNPDYVFPKDASTNGERLMFRAEALGHPLIPTSEKVCNDFALNDEQAIAIITGSNMAGKSTLLRTLGTNLCLAYAGAPVNAASIETSLFRVFTCIKVSDSVTDGMSYFYAEVKRLKALLAACDNGDGLPLFFLIDEIFRGTNNVERHIGSRSYIRGLAKRSVVGAIATHDLELVKLAEEIPGIANYHFREEVRDGRMIFDYELRPGPCPTTNALKIMRMEGLPVEIED